MSPFRTSPGLIGTLLVVLVGSAAVAREFSHLGCIASPANLERLVATATTFNFGACGLGAALLPWLELRGGAVIGLLAGTRNLPIAAAAAVCGAIGDVAAAVMATLMRPVIVGFLLQLFAICRRWMRLRPPAAHA